MALVIANRVREASATIGTGAMSLLGAALGYQSFAAAVGTGNTTYYAIVSGAGQWEIGLGTVVGTELQRTTVLDSSSGGSLVNFAPGTKDVFATLPANTPALVEDLASPATGKGAEMVATGVHTFSTVGEALAAIDWANEASQPGGASVLKYIAPAKWAAILNKTSTDDHGPEIADAFLAEDNLYFPRGKYNNNTAPWIARTGQEIHGAGRLNSTIYTTGNFPIIRLGADGATFTRPNIHDLGFVGTSEGSKPLQRAIYSNSLTAGYVANGSFKRLQVSNMGGGGFMFDADGTLSSFAGLQNNVFEAIKVQGSKAACFAFRGFVSANSFLGVTCAQSDSYGMDFSGCRAIQSIILESCQFESLGVAAGSAVWGIYAPLPANLIGIDIEIRSCYFENISNASTGGGIYAVSPARLYVNGGIFASMPNGLEVVGNNSRVVIDGPPSFYATPNVPSPTAHIHMRSSDATSTLEIRTRPIWYKDAAVTAFDYLKYTSWTGVRRGFVDAAGSTEYSLRARQYIHQSMTGGAVTVANAAITDSLVSNTLYGTLRVHNRSNGSSAVFLISGSNCKLMFENGTVSGFSHTSGTASKINVFRGASTITIENLTGASVSLYWVLDTDELT